MSLEWTRRKGYVRVVDGLSRALGDYPYTPPYAPYSYLVFERAGITYARNGSTGELEFADKDAAKVTQRALDALTSGRTWREKVLVKGDFIVNRQAGKDYAIGVPSYTILEVQGKLTLADGQNVHIIKNTGNNNIEIIGGILDGNKVNQGPGYHSGIRFEFVTDFLIKDVTVKNNKFGGIGITWGGAGKEPQRGRIINVLAEYNNDYGIGIGYGYYISVISCISRNNRFGFYATTSHFLEHVANHAYDQSESGFYFEGTNSEIKIIGGTSKTNGHHGIVLAGGNQFSILGVGILQNGYDGIDMGSANYCTISGNIIRDNTLWGIDEFGGDNNIIVGNTVRANAAGQINIVGANTICKFNDGFVTENSGTAVILAGATSVTVPHGLVDTPNKVLVTPRGDIGNVWVSARNGTNITINCETAPAVDVIVDWYAEI